MTTATPPATDTLPAPRRPSLGIRFAIAFVLGAILVAGVGTGALYAYGQQYTGKVLPGVSVGGVDLSGLSPELARRALQDAYASLEGGRVVVAGPDGELTIGYSAIGRRADVDAMLAAALTAGRQGEPVADLIGVPQTALRGVRLEPLVVYDAAKLEAAVAAIAKAVDLDPVDATLVASDDGDVALTAGRDGRVIDQAALVAAIGARVARLDAPAELAVDLDIVGRTPVIDTADAEAARAAADRMAEDLVLTRGKEQWTIPGTALRKLISFSPTVDGSIVPVVDVAGIGPLLKAVARDVDQKARNATFRLSGKRIVVGKGSREGRALDQTATRALVVDALMARQGNVAAPAVQPVVAVTQPAISTAGAKAIAPRMKQISKWTTYFPITEKNGFGANIWIPAKLITGHVVAPGETFDFWKAVGPVTREKGYRQGGAIINGKTEPQGALAGGICSCSTTLFNAALRAGFKMGARRNHYYYIDRYPLGLDATVFISAGGSKQTMSWTNDTRYPVLIRGVNTRSGNSGYVTFVLYSVPTGRTISIGTPVVKNVRQSRDTIQYTNSLPKGSSKRIEYPVDGKDVWRTVTVREKGKVIRRTTYYSHYSVITGIVLVGTAGSSDGDAASPTPSP
jgi:vancomycin resistance protein YoaR